MPVSQRKDEKRCELRRSPTESHPRQSIQCRIQCICLASSDFVNTSPSLSAPTHAKCLACEASERGRPLPFRCPRFPKVDGRARAETDLKRCSRGRGGHFGHQYYDLDRLLLLGCYSAESSCGPQVAETMISKTKALRSAGSSFAR